MDIKKIKQYWLEEASEALKVAWDLYEKADYTYSLFFGHLSIEKLLKAIYVEKNREHAPYLHNLLRLAEISGIELNDAHKDLLIKITTFNVESRYPDEKRSFRKKCTQDFTINELNQIEDIYKWLKSMI